MDNQERLHNAQEIVARFGGYPKAIDAIMEFSAQLWQLAVSDSTQNSDAKSHFLHYYRIIDENQVRDNLRHLDEQGLTLLLEQLQRCAISRYRESGMAAYQRTAFQPMALLRETIGGLKPDQELRYFAMASIRQRSSCDLNSGTAHTFQVLTDVLNSMIDSWRTSHNGFALRGDGAHPTWHYKSEFVSGLEEPIRQFVRGAGSRSGSVGAFIECCRAVNYLQIGGKPGWVSVRAKQIDSAFLISHLFGMPTGISGFDDLFGGGGLMLTEASSYSSEPSIEGRTILTIGRFGTGKSLLSLQIAAEVARKGGLAWVMAFEQSAEECLFALESVCAIPDDGTVSIARTNKEASELLATKREGTGGIIFSRPGAGSLDAFEEDFSSALASMQRCHLYPLRLAVIDPINSIIRERLSDGLRRQTLRMLDDAKRAGVNVWLIAEEDSEGQSKGSEFEQYIADTVINLFLEEKSDYLQRYFQIDKSRFQREQRGKHPFSIVPGAGISIFPSAAAVSARIRPRSIRAPNTPIEFGLPALKSILGPDALHAGDVIVLQGPSGCFKTPMGISFLLGTDEPKGGFAAGKKTASLLVAARDNLATIHDALKRHQAQRVTAQRDKISTLRISSAGSGYVKPGEVLRQIEQELIDSRLQRCSVDRVVIDNVEHWELSCPFIKAEPTFGDTLVDLLRRSDVTSLLICEDFLPESGSALQRSVVANADCVIQFIRIEFHGRYHVMIRVLKTRSMKHRRELFELKVGDGGVDVDKSSSLLRIASGGGIAPVKIRLILISENPIRSNYNESLLSAVKSILSSDAEIASPNNIYLRRALDLGFSSAIDELQILELEEFELASPEISSGSDLPLHRFSMDADSDFALKDILPALKKRVVRGSRYTAVPFYNDVSLLAYRRDLISEAKVNTSWLQLATECSIWESERPSREDIFFDFAAFNDECFNCLFLEIFFSIDGERLEQRSCELSALLRSSSAMHAAKILNILCSRAHRLHTRERLSDIASSSKDFVVRNTAKPVVWRHWYSTMNEMMVNIPVDERASIQVCPLPGSVNMANERYLAVPSYSAATDVALKIISLFTSNAAESDRLEFGVGLPTRTSFYDISEANMPSRSVISPMFSAEDTPLEYFSGSKSLRRSLILGYSEARGLLASYLRRIIELPKDREPEYEKQFHDLLNNLLYRISAIQ